MFRNIAHTVTPLIIAIIVGMSITSIAAQEPPEIAPEDLRQEFIETSALPAIEAIISSLESQNAPVPPELTELTELADDTDAFYSLAGRYFGHNWQERLSSDAASLKDPEDALMVRTRLFLSSLKANAGRIAKTSPLTESEIAALADNLTRFSEHVSADKDREKFFAELEKSHEKIFPADEGPDISDFRASVSLLLADTIDAISILVKGNKVERLSRELDDLAIGLQLVGGTQELTAWLALFDSFAGKLLSNSVQADRVTIIKDIRALLRNLVTYLSTLEEEGVDGNGILEDAEELLNLAEENVFDEEEFEELIHSTEEMLTKISEPKVSP